MTITLNAPALGAIIYLGAVGLLTNCEWAKHLLGKLASIFRDSRTETERETAEWAARMRDRQRHPSTQEPSPGEVRDGSGDADARYWRGIDSPLRRPAS